MIILFSTCCDTLCASVRAVWVVFCLHFPVGCLEVFLQSTETGPDSEIFFTNRQTMKNAWNSQVLVFQLFRSQCVDEDEAVGRSPPRLLREPPACASVDCLVILFNSLKRLSFSLSCLLTARNGSKVLLSLCHVFVVESLAFSFRLSKVRSLM